MVKNIKKELRENVSRFFASRIWKTLNPFSPFGLVLDDGRTVWVAVDFYNIYMPGSVFIFEDLEKFGTYANIFGFSRDWSFLKGTEDFFSQDGLAIEIKEGKGYLSVPTYKLFRFKPHKPLKKTYKGEDIKLASEVLEKLFLFSQMTLHNKEILENFAPVIEGRGLIPVLNINQKKQTLTMGKQILDFKPAINKKLKIENEILLSKLSHILHYGTWAMEYFYTAAAFPDGTHEDELKFVNGILIYDLDNDYMEPILIEVDAVEEPREFLNKLTQELTGFEKLPQTVLIQDDRTRLIVEDLFTKTGSKIEVKEKIPELIKAENEIFDFESDQAAHDLDIDTIDEINEVLSNMDDGSYPYSNRIKQQLKSLKEDILEYHDLDEEESGKSYPVLTIRFEYTDTNGNYCIVETENTRHLSEVLKCIIERIYGPHFTLDRWLEEAANSGDLDNRLYDVRLGDEFVASFLDRETQMRLKVTDLRPEPSEIIKILEVNP